MTKQHVSTYLVEEARNVASRIRTLKSDISIFTINTRGAKALKKNRSRRRQSIGPAYLVP